MRHIVVAPGFNSIEKEAGNSAQGPSNPGLVLDMLQARQRTAAGVVRNGRTVLPGGGSVEPENPSASLTTPCCSLTSSTISISRPGVAAHPIPMSPHTVVMRRA
jgi:hypothetical protein